MGYTPPYPLTIGQDPDQLGVDATIIATGGTKSNSCNRGPDQAEITSLVLDYLQLPESTVNWITGELAQYYPGAHILDDYPLYPASTVTYDGTTATLIFHHDPLDPGTFEVHVTAVQEYGGTTEIFIQVPVYLLEATLVDDTTGGTPPPGGKPKPRPTTPPIRWPKPKP